LVLSSVSGGSIPSLSLERYISTQQPYPSLRNFVKMAQKRVFMIGQILSFFGQSFGFFFITPIPFLGQWHLTI
jgi:hypothetical protein